MLPTTESIITKLKALQNEQRRTMAMRNFPTKLEIIGVTSPDIKKTVKETIAKTNEYSIASKKELVWDLLQTNYHECHHLAYHFLEQEKKTLDALTAKECKSYAVCIDNWVLSDTYSTFILGVLWRNGRITDEYINQLANGDDVWKKRCALVSTVALNQKARGGTGDVPRTIAHCKKAVADKRSMIVKALSWALRVLIQHDSTAVKNFLNNYENELHNQVKREVTNKLKSGLKNPKN
ncbi:MAG: DNA alkylation repair protein [Salinivirgaceae bacterium]|jgi:3-methyladenine DNA glycosylase AlkD|nr:DNA alkylation repair protein [Salinivirgaceae bacterium]